MRRAVIEAVRLMESRARPELTLITRHPFYFVGAAPWRFIVHARRLTSRGLRLTGFAPGRGHGAAIP